MIEGTTTLAGAIEVSLIDGLMPSLGDTFELLTTVGEIDGKFAEIAEPDLGELLSLELLYETDRVLAVISATLDGDYNADGRVDAADYTVWRDTLGSTTKLAADGDGDGVVGPEDRSVWVDNYGATLGMANAVPEPTGVIMGGLAAGLGCMRRPRRRTLA